MQSSFSISNWKFKSLIFANSIFILLLATFILKFSFWNQLDHFVFRWLNSPLKENASLRILWALANHRLADWLEDLFILGFYCAAIYQTPQEFRKKRIAQFIFCVVFTAVTILLINRLLCRDLLKLRRTSPSLILPGTIYLPQFLPWISVKVDSTKSFPGDHATTALMFALSYAYFVRGKLACLAILYGFFLCLPRLAVGAHWLSDIVVGSGGIVLFMLSWAFFTPLSKKWILFIEKGLNKIKNSSLFFYKRVFYK